MASIHSPRFVKNPYIGEFPRLFPHFPPRRFNAFKYAAILHFWDFVMPGAQKAAWNAAAPAGMDGRGLFYKQNKFYGQFYGSVNDPREFFFAPANNTVPTDPVPPAAVATGATVVHSNRFSVASASVTIQASGVFTVWAIYATRPYRGTYKPLYNPVVIISAEVANAGATSLDVTGDVNYTIGGCPEGMKMRLGARNIAFATVKIVGPRNVFEVTSA